MIEELCFIIGASKSGFYDYIKAEPKLKKRELQDRKGFDRIAKEYLHRSFDKGIEILVMRLERNGHPMNHKKVWRLYRKYGLQYRIRKLDPSGRLD